VDGTGARDAVVGPEWVYNTTHSMDVRVGGEWVHTMHGPDGRDYPNRIRYAELVEPERIVYDHVNPPRYRTTVTFEDLGGTTKMTFRMVFETPEDKRKVVEAFKADVGLQQTLGRMEEYLAKL
jgi:uncharacterized protein YndB with AHSA1/START domain